MKKVISYEATQLRSIENFVNKKLEDFKNQGYEIIDVILAGRSNSYSRDWGVMIFYDDCKK